MASKLTADGGRAVLLELRADEAERLDKLKAKLGMRHTSALMRFALLRLAQAEGVEDAAKKSSTEAA